MAAKLIINADDFGLSPVVNKAIALCFKEGYINSTSLMVNTPAVKEAIEIAEKEGFIGQLGVHVNLTEGKPLTNVTSPQLVGADGNWIKDSVSRMRLSFGNVEIKELKAEIRAQVEKAQESGVVPAHVNTHHHVHTLPALIPLFRELCREKGFKLRLAQTHPGSGYLKGVYRAFINNGIRRDGSAFSEYFETIASYTERKEKFRHAVVEIMVHPTLDGSGNLTDALEPDKLYAGMDFFKQK